MCWNQRIGAAGREPGSISMALTPVSRSEGGAHRAESLALMAILLSMMSLSGITRSPSCKQNRKSVQVVQILFRILAVSCEKSPGSHIIEPKMVFITKLLL
jgi:hypothetical protein